MAARAAAACLWLALLGCQCALAGAADPGPADDGPESPAELAGFLARCVDSLSVQDVGLARVARACPGVEYHVLHGVFAGAIDARTWAAGVDRANLRGLERLARTYDAPVARSPPDAAALAPLLASLERTRHDTRSWWSRFLDEVSAWLQRSDASAAQRSWLDRYFPQFKLDPRSVEGFVHLVTGLIVVAVGGGALYLWRRRRRTRSGRDWFAALTPPRAAAGATQPPTLWADPGRRLAARYAASVAALDAGGAVPGARALTFRELAARIGGNAELEPLLVAAPLVERIVYAPGAPPEADVVTAERQLDRVVLAR